MIQDQRVLYNGADISVSVNDYRSGQADFAYTTGQYLYIGSILPFNNLWFDLTVGTASGASVSVDIWWGNAWVPAVDILDETAALSVSGRLTWNTDRLKGWDFEQTSEDVAGITSFKIYNRFWTRLSWSANLAAGTKIKYIGQKFSNDDILYSYYPDLSISTVKTSFESGKTTWDEQHYMAAEHIVTDLKKREIIASRSQLMDYSMFTAASCHRIAEMVYIAFGAPYFDQLIEARKEYQKAMNMKFFGTDLNSSGSLDNVERRMSTNFSTR